MKYRQPPPPNAYVATLVGLRCRCGERKSSGRSLCFHCYYRLPEDMRRALYRRMGMGYEAAYDAAATWLDDVGHAEP